MNSKHILALVFLIFSICSCSELELKEGQENFEKQDYRSAFIRLTPAARAGNPEAQYAVGYMYYTGQGTVQNRDKAKEWIKKAARQGNKNAIAALNKLNNKPVSPYEPSKNPKYQPL